MSTSSPPFSWLDIIHFAFVLVIYVFKVNEIDDFLIYELTLLFLLN